MSKLGLGKQTDAGAAAPAAVFETCSCICRLQGDVRNEVPLTGVTAPELIFLRGIHGGNDTVVSVKVDGFISNNAVAERMRLLKKYPRYGELFGELFGKGLSPQLPRTIADAEEIAKYDLEQAEANAAPPTEAPRSAPASTPAPNPMEDV